MIVRPIYQKQIDQLIGKSFIKVLIWQRRVGKSTLLKSIINKFQNNYIYIDKEQKIYDNIYNSDTLYNYIKNELLDNKQLVAIDEIQNIKWRESAILSIYNEYPNLEIRITWSNSNMLSSELTTHLRWRYISITVYPFLYSEFCEYNKINIWSESMNKYIQDWSMPSVYPLIELENNEQRRKDLINTIIIKDIAQRYNLRDIDFVYDIYTYLLNNIWNITNTKWLIDYIKSSGKNISINTLQSYIYYICDSFLAYECQLFDIQGKKIFDRLRKYYVSDASMRKLYFWWYDWFIGKNIENIVYMTAKTYWRNIYVGRIWDLEIDFVLEKNGKYIYLQIAYILSDQNVRDREYKSLQKIKNSRPKYVVTMDNINLWIYEWIQHIQLRNLEKIF